MFIFHYYTFQKYWVYKMNNRKSNSTANEKQSERNE